MRQLGPRDVGSILQAGGTMLGSARAPEFATDAGQEQGIANLASMDIDSLIVVGGNGSQQGSLALSRRGFPVVGIASTIDNDLAGSDITLGVDTALNIALEALDRIRTTASSHSRVFLVEVMGRHCGYLGLMAGIAGGAELVAIPELNLKPQDMLVGVRDVVAAKGHAVAVIAEGWADGATGLATYLRENREAIGGAKVRVTILGHVQRGGTPTYCDRMLGTRFGAEAVDALAGDQSGVLVGLHGRLTGISPLEEVVGQDKPLSPKLIELARVLAR